VRPLLRYSTRAAYDLTARARAAADATENQQIANMKAEGKSNRQIGRELGIDEGTVRCRGKAAEKWLPQDGRSPSAAAMVPGDRPPRSADQLWAGTADRLRSMRRDVVDLPLGEHGGRVSRTTGDGLLASFECVAPGNSRGDGDGLSCGAAIGTMIEGQTRQSPLVADSMRSSDGRRGPLNRAAQPCPQIFRMLLIVISEAPSDF
jgi:hypothetical protein